MGEHIQRIGVIAIVDDDEDLREALRSILKAASFAVDTFPSAEAYLKSPHQADTKCLVLDIRMPGMSGIELQARLRDRGDDIPIVFISGHGDAAIRDRVMKAGASGFLRKPVRSDALLNEIHLALQRKPKGTAAGT